MKIKRMIFIIMGCICFGLGTAGIVLPVVPTVPLYLATAFFFANSSKRLHAWFVSTALYKKYLQSYVDRRSMTAGTKATLLICEAVIMGISCYFVRRLVWVQILLGMIFLSHFIYFVFVVRTIKREKKEI